MRKLLAIPSFIFILIFALSGYKPTQKITSGLPIVYGVATVISFLLLIGCLILVKKNRKWFALLFSSVAIVNIGYTLLSISGNLNLALWSNRLAYLGSVFLPLAMLMIILNVVNISYFKKLPIILFAISALIFLIAASPGILNIYYKEVALEIIDGVSSLHKVYGPLHPIYLVYLVGYFTAMVCVIIRTSIKKTIESTTHAVIIAIAVFVNIGVWFIEQIIDINFEMLSISYIISELFLLGVHLVVKENQRLKEILHQVEKAKIFAENGKSSISEESPTAAISITAEKIEEFINGVSTLTATEKEIYECYLKRLTTKEILLKLEIKENTLKYHNKNIYSKLGVNSRKEIIEIYKQIEIINNKV